MLVYYFYLSHGNDGAKMQNQLLGYTEKMKNNNAVFNFPTYQNKLRSEMKHN